MSKNPSGTTPSAPLVPGEEWKELLGDKNHSLGLTTHRVIRIVQDDTHTQSEVIFLDKIECVKYSRHIEWGYLLGAIIMALVFSIGGSILGSQVKGFKGAGTMGIVLGLAIGIGLLIAFFLSRKAKIKICAGSESIEVTSDYKNVNQFLDFIQKVQAAIVERNPGPKGQDRVDSAPSPLIGARNSTYCQR